MIKKMVRRSSAVFILFIVVSFSYSPDASSEARKGFLWKVQSKTATVHLLGSIHMMKKEIYPLPKEIEEAFDKSNVLVVEANVNDIGKMDILKLAEKAFYPENDGLDRHVSSETYELIKKETAGLGLPLDLVRRQKPWFLSLTLEALEFMKLGMDPTYGIDNHFLSKVGEKKKILELESLDYQIDLLSGFSDYDQELFILLTLKDFDKTQQKIDQLIKAWKSGDTESMESIATSETRADQRLSAIYEKIIYERNRKMATRIEEFLSIGESYFVVVGAGHLIGSKGIVELLRGRGYPVEQVLLSR